MYEQKKISLENCRLCQESKGTSDFFGNSDFEEKIQKCFSFQINNEFQLYLPCFVCDNCTQKIDDILLFVNKVTEIDKLLRQSLIQLIGKEELEIIKTGLVKDFENSGAKLLFETFIPKRCSICLKTFRTSKLKKKNYLNHLKKKHNLSYCLKCNAAIKDDFINNHQCREENNVTDLKKISTFSNHITADVNNFHELEECSEIKDGKILYNSSPTNEEFLEKCQEIDVNEINKITKNPKLHKCLECKKAFNSDENLQKHTKKIHQRCLMCPVENCKKKCATNYSLKIHVLGHESRRPFLCVTCGKGFITKNSLTCHEKIHLTTKSYHCKLCNIGFSVRSNYRAHEKKYHEGVRFYCSQCTKEFLTKCSLERHEKIHAGVKEFKCSQCPSQFYTNKELLKHQKYHQGLKPHKCEECFKTFFERHHLVIHLRSHSGERPYKCKILGCDKSFVDSQKLKRHQSARHTAIG